MKTRSIVSAALVALALIYFALGKVVPVLADRWSSATANCRRRCGIW